MRIILKDGSGEMKLKYLSEEPDRHGNVRVYFRKRGRQRIRMRETPGTDAFMTEYKAALAARPLPPSAARIVPGTYRWLAMEYFKSPEFKRLDGATQKIRRSMIEATLPTWGGGQIHDLEPKYVRKIRDEKAGFPHAANNLLKALRVMFGWAVEAGHMKHNPARDLAKIKAPSDGHHTWTVAEIEQFRERHPAHTKAGLAMALLLYLGVRRSDVVGLGRQLEAGDGWLRLIEKKGDSQQLKARDLPILPSLRAVLNLHRGKMHYLLTSFGKPFTPAGFGNWFRERCNEAGLTHCSAHGLRKAGATIAADEGASDRQLMALFGWTSPGQATSYTRRADRKRLAGEAAKLLDQTPKEAKRGRA